MIEKWELYYQTNVHVLVEGIKRRPGTFCPSLVSGLFFGFFKVKIVLKFLTLYQSWVYLPSNLLNWVYWVSIELNIAQHFDMLSHFWNLFLSNISTFQSNGHGKTTW